MPVQRRALFLPVCALLLVWAADAASQTFTNPILRGGYPDPSICRDDGSYYVVNSTFEYFPGLPIHKSRDLVNWELIGYGLHREEQASGQVNLVDVQSDGGIHAPTIRCRDGKYYIITTNVYLPPGDDQQTEFVNFVLTADNIEGPWSMPKVLDGAPGIDPDIFFDDDGRVWYVGTHSPEKPNFPGEGEIWLQEIDTESWSLTGERHFLWRGACGGVWAEGPHIYKRDGRYYLMVAEGGTSFDHAVMIASSTDITGPYLSNPRNPILTSRHLSYDHWVNSTGHADLIELPDGRWYMVALGIRGDLERRSNMGRESHLIPVTWETEPYWWKDEKIAWPVAAPTTGSVQRSSPLPFAGVEQRREWLFVDAFDERQLNLEWNFRRVPFPGTYSLESRPGFLRLAANPAVIAERARASLIGVRQVESEFEFAAAMEFAPTRIDAEAGLNLFQKDNNYLSFTLRRVDAGYLLRSVLSIPEDDAKRTREVRVLAEQRIEDYHGRIVLQIEADRDTYHLRYALGDNAEFVDFLETGSDHLLSRGYTGAYLGLYSTSNGRESADYADFDWVRHEARERSGSD